MSHLETFFAFARSGGLKLTDDALGNHLLTTGTIAAQLADIPLVCEKRTVPDGPFTHEIDIARLENLLGHAGWKSLQLRIAMQVWPSEPEPAAALLETLLACADDGSLTLHGRGTGEAILAASPAVERLRADLLPLAPNPVPAAGLTIHKHDLHRQLGQENYETLMTRLRRKQMENDMHTQRDAATRLSKPSSGERDR